ncbi:hypothetical protein ACWDAZ_37885, partial [Streptomyces sp. NPDC001215]
MKAGAGRSRGRQERPRRPTASRRKSSPSAGACAPRGIGARTGGAPGPALVEIAARDDDVLIIGAGHRSR